eukprot:g2715.t1
MEKYKVIRTIGKGTFGTVSTVERRSDGKIMVWKELDYGPMTDKEKQHVVAEVNFLRELRHPFIVKYYDRIIDRSKMKLFIVMESCDGGDLQNLIRKCKRQKVYLREEKIWKMFAQLVLALSACHFHQEDGVVKPILHRDIKPGNIFLDKHQNIKIGDFGLAKELNSKSTFAYTNVGTPYYMSPELVNDDRYNESSDIWALGCLLYELTALRTPFDAHNAVTLAVKINTASVPRIPYKYSQELNDVIHRMLQKSSALRPSLKKLQQVRGPNGIFESYLRFGQLKIREHRFDYNCALKQRELQHKSKALKQREGELKKREMSLETLRRALEARERELDARERRNSNASPRSILESKRATMTVSPASNVSAICEEHSPPTVGTSRVRSAQGSGSRSASLGSKDGLISPPILGSGLRPRLKRRDSSGVLDVGTPVVFSSASERRVVRSQRRTSEIKRSSLETLAYCLPGSEHAVKHRTNTPKLEYVAKAMTFDSGGRNIQRAKRSGTTSSASSSSSSSERKVAVGEI